MASYDKLVQACRENTSVRVSVRSWMNEERAKVLERLAKAEGNEVYLLQGEARRLHKLHEELPALTKLKEQG